MAGQEQDEKRAHEDLPLSDREVEACVRRANLLNDVLFKYLFASKGREENLLRLLNDTLGPRRGIVSLEYLDREKDPRRHEGRGSFVDVLARSCDGRICHVEVQLNREGAFFERSLYYASCSLADQLDVKEGYDRLRPVIFVSILRFVLFRDRKATWHSVHRLLDEENHRCYTDGLEFHFLELPKLKRCFRSGELEDTGLSRLLRYLGRMGGKQEMDRLAEQDTGVEQLERGVRSFFRSRGNLALYMLQERAETDYRNAFKYREEKALAKGRAKGRAEGEAKGRAEGSLEMLFSLVRDGLLPLTQAWVSGTDDEYAITPPARRIMRTVYS